MGFLPDPPSLQLWSMVRFHVSHNTLYWEIPEKGVSDCCAFLPTIPTLAVARAYALSGGKETKSKFQLHTKGWCFSMMLATNSLKVWSMSWLQSCTNAVLQVLWKHRFLLCPWTKIWEGINRKICDLIDVWFLNKYCKPQWMTSVVKRIKGESY